MSDLYRIYGLAPMIPQVISEMDDCLSMTLFETCWRPMTVCGLVSGCAPLLLMDPNCPREGGGRGVTMCVLAPLLSMDHNCPREGMEGLSGEVLLLE